MHIEKDVTPYYTHTNAHTKSLWEKWQVEKNTGLELFSYVKGNFQTENQLCEFSFQWYITETDLPPHNSYSLVYCKTTGRLQLLIFAPL